jgi:hypothetical protein
MRPALIAAVAALAALAALAVSFPAAAGTVGTGLRGLVTRGPITPVCKEGVPCSAPAKHIKITFVRNGVAKSVVTGADGRYTIALTGGTYAVRFPSAPFGFRPRTVFVPAGRLSTRNFSIDTGIR